MISSSGQIFSSSAVLSSSTQISDNISGSVGVFFSSSTFLQNQGSVISGSWLGELSNSLYLSNVKDTISGSYLGEGYISSSGEISTAISGSWLGALSRSLYEVVAISASGEVHINKRLFTSDISASGEIVAINNITSSGNISSSQFSTASFGRGEFKTIDLSGSLIVDSIEATALTASGFLSASEGIIAPYIQFTGEGVGEEDEYSAFIPQLDDTLLIAGSKRIVIRAGTCKGSVGGTNNDETHFPLMVNFPALDFSGTAPNINDGKFQSSSLNVWGNIYAHGQDSFGQPGHITASGNISSSGTIYANAISVGGGIGGAGLNVTTITSSANVFLSGSGYLSASKIIANTYEVSGGQILSQSQQIADDISGSVSSSLYLQNVMGTISGSWLGALSRSLYEVNNISASFISASNISASNLFVTSEVSASSIRTNFLEITSSLLISSESTEFGNSTDDTHFFLGNITASNTLWMSGGIDDSGTSITASGNIYGRNLVSDSASVSTRFENVTASLGNVTSSIQFITASIGNITASIQNITSSIGNITASIDTISDNQSFATSSIADITASIVTINQNQSNATQSIADITASITTINENQSSATQSIADITASITTINENHSFATSSIADITASIATISNNQSAATQSITDITASILQLDNEMAQATASISSRQAITGSIQSHLSESLNAVAGISSSGTVEITPSGTPTTALTVKGNISMSGDVLNYNLQKTFNGDSEGGVVFDTYSRTSFRTAKYIVQVTSGSVGEFFQSSEILVSHDLGIPGNAFTTEYAQLNNTVKPFTKITARVNFSAGNIELVASSSHHSCSIRYSRQLIPL